MIARAKTSPRTSAALAISARFLSLLPAIRNRPDSLPQRAARTPSGPHREVVANCWVAFVRLVERGLIEHRLPHAVGPVRHQAGPRRPPRRGQVELSAT